MKLKQLKKSMKQYHPIFFLHLKLTLKNNNNKKGLPPSSTFRKCPDDKLTIYFAWPNLKSGQKTKWPNIVDRSVYIMKDMDPIKIFLFNYSRHKISSLLLDLGPTLASPFPQH